MKRVCSQCSIKREEEDFTSPRGALCKKCRKANAKASARASHLKSSFGITPEEYDELAKNGCMVCGGARRGNMPVDHDHAREKTHGIRVSVRGVICKRENRLLRDCRDDPQLLRALADYIENPPAWRILNTEGAETI